MYSKVLKFDHYGASVAFNSNKVNSISYRVLDNIAQVTISFENRDDIVINEDDKDKFEDIYASFLNVYTRWKTFNELVIDIEEEE